MKGIDVSTWQGKIDWDKVKVDGIEFAMLRAGYGNNNIDKWFIRNVTECNRLNIPVGVYWFSYAYTVDMARREAKQCIEAIRPYKIDFPVCFDFEYGSVEYAEKKGVKITKSMATDFAIAFLTEVENAGYHPMNYTNQDYMKRYFDMSKIKYDLWLALWPKSGKPDKDRSGECEIWQYTDKGRVNGIQGNVDMNIAYKDYMKGNKEGDTMFTRTLRFGDTGPDVGQAQRLLKILGYYTGPIDDKYGPGQGFKTAVEAFQKDNGLKVDSNIGPATQAKMTNIMLDAMEAPKQDLAEAKKLAQQIINL